MPAMYSFRRELASCHSDVPRTSTARHARQIGNDNLRRIAPAVRGLVLSSPYFRVLLVPVGFSLVEDACASVLRMRRRQHVSRAPSLFGYMYLRSMRA